MCWILWQTMVLVAKHRNPYLTSPRLWPLLRRTPLFTRTKNPLSQLGILLMRDGVAERLTELSGSPEAQIKKLAESSPSAFVCVHAVCA